MRPLGQPKRPTSAQRSELIVLCEIWHKIIDVQRESPVMTLEVLRTAVLVRPLGQSNRPTSTQRSEPIVLCEIWH